MATKTYGTFTKDGKTRTASSPGEAVNLRYEGWSEKKTKSTKDDKSATK